MLNSASSTRPEAMLHVRGGDRGKKEKNVSFRCGPPASMARADPSNLCRFCCPSHRAYLAGPPCRVHVHGRTNELRFGAPHCARNTKKRWAAGQVAAGGARCLAWASRMVARMYRGFGASHPGASEWEASQTRVSPHTSQRTCAWSHQTARIRCSAVRTRSYAACWSRHLCSVLDHSPMRASRSCMPWSRHRYRIRCAAAGADAAESHIWQIEWHL